MVTTNITVNPTNHNTKNIDAYESMNELAVLPATEVSENANFRAPKPALKKTTSNDNTASENNNLFSELFTKT